MLGIECMWECPSCGNVIKTNSPFWDEKHRKNIKEPKKCCCGRKSGFRLMSFKECQFEVVPEGYEVVKEATTNNITEEDLLEESVENQE